MIRRFLNHRRYMREHRWTHAHLSAYLDTELSDPEKARVEEHVGVCPHCRRVLATLKRTLEAVRGLPRVAEPEVTEGVIARLRSQG